MEEYLARARTDSPIPRALRASDGRNAAEESQPGEAYYYVPRRTTGRCTMSDCRQALTRRRWLALSAAFVAARGFAAGKNVNDEIVDWAKHAPLAMQFRGHSAGQCRAWQREFSAKLSELLGPYKPPERW